MQAVSEMMGEQVPLATPVLAILHDWQLEVQAVAQQTPSIEQLFCWHWPLALQVAPRFFLGRQACVVGSQNVVMMQSRSLAQTVDLHADTLAHRTLPWHGPDVLVVGQLPLASQTRAVVKVAVEWSALSAQAAATHVLPAVLLTWQTPALQVSAPEHDVAALVQPLGSGRP